MWSINSVAEGKRMTFQILNNLKKIEQILGLHLFLELKAPNTGYLKTARMKVKFK